MARVCVRTQCAAQAALELQILRPSKDWGYRRVPPHWASALFCSFTFLLIFFFNLNLLNLNKTEVSSEDFF